ncbi:putative phage abortive infection protein [Neobacillus pocheonensis]|uniref:Phage abortive infection protein n=1 Tax=Neobacillus pocheonensis TaxID=363869 RepID=A0ABT0WFV8_9BACI|nr:putative phage abortive infection protein [Neobacillus pocheonensis]
MYGGISKDLGKKINKELSEENRKELKNEIKRLREQRIKNKSTLIITGIIFLLLFGCLLYLWNWSESFGKSMQDFGAVFGSYIGPVISALALGAAILAYGSQQSQLRMQKDQVQKQRIENQFFQLINLHNEIVNSMFYYKDDLDFKGRFQGDLKGRAYFRAVYFKFIKYYHEDQSPDKNKYYSIMRKLDNDEQDQLFHYFRNMYQLFNCVYKNQDKLSDDEQNDYIEIINSQLTYYEKQLLFFNTKFYGSDGFYQILSHYNFFADYDKAQDSNIISKFENDADLLDPEGKKKKEQEKE